MTTRLKIRTEMIIGASAGYIVRLPNGRTKQVDDGGGRDALPFVWRLVADFRDAGIPARNQDQICGDDR